MQASLNGNYDVAMIGSPLHHPRAGKVELLGEFPYYSGKNFTKLLKQRYAAINKICKSYKPDIVHMRNHLGDIISLISIKLAAPKCKVTLDIRSMSTGNLSDKMFRVSSFAYYRYFDHIFALNDNILMNYAKYTRKKSVLPLGYDPYYFYCDRQENNEFKARETLNCIYYGNLSKHRKLGTMVAGFVDAIGQGCDIRLTIVGSGDDLTHLRSLVPEAQKNRIVFLSFMEHHDLVNLLRKHQMGISYVPHDKIFEPNLPLKTVEILACGIPVIATDTVGNRILLKDGQNGYLIGEDRQAMRDTLIKIWQNGAPPNAAQEALESVKKYSWRELTEDWLLPVYEKLTSGRGPKKPA